ncbi:MAG: hypothetical protein J6Y42_02945, partial [Bacilli bacterium]|nr:hypothetical protein [Bacilli bacterium]
RIGASDDLVSGESTFMVEMKEAESAISGATKNSLILFDELGRGTATYDGMSLAQAILEYVSQKIRCKTLFSTHYHELTSLESDISSIKNVHIDVMEENGNVTFLHKVVDGAIDKSYGIHVAKLANMPQEILSRASSIRKVYEAHDTMTNKIPDHVVFNFDEEVKKEDTNEVLNYLDEIDINNLRPIDAINVLDELKNIHVSAYEENGNITFLHKIKEGAVDKSYGIYVAKLAKMPNSLIKRANEILSLYETKEVNRDIKIQEALPIDELINPSSEIEEEIKNINLLETTPLDALNILYRIQEKINK